MWCVRLFFFCLFVLYMNVLWCLPICVTHMLKKGGRCLRDVWVFVFFAFVQEHKKIVSHLCVMCLCVCVLCIEFFSSLMSSDAAGQLNVLHLDSHASGMDGTQVGVLEQVCEISLRRFLQRLESPGLKPQLGTPRPRDFQSEFSNKSTERELWDQQIRRSLILSNIFECLFTWPVSSPSSRLVFNTCTSVLPASHDFGSDLGSRHCGSKPK